MSFHHIFLFREFRLFDFSVLWNSFPSATELMSLLRRSQETTWDRS